MHCCAGDPQSKVNRETSNFWINDHNTHIVIVFLDSTLYWERDIVNFIYKEKRQSSDVSQWCLDVDLAPWVRAVCSHMARQTHVCSIQAGQRGAREQWLLRTTWTLKGHWSSMSYYLVNFPTSIISFRILQFILTLVIVVINNWWNSYKKPSWHAELYLNQVLHYNLHVLSTLSPPRPSLSRDIICWALIWIGCHIQLPDPCNTTADTWK